MRVMLNLELTLFILYFQFCRVYLFFILQFVNKLQYRHIFLVCIFSVSHSKTL